jgi:hypothetical protein
MARQSANTQEFPPTLPSCARQIICNTANRKDACLHRHIEEGTCYEHDEEGSQRFAGVDCLSPDVDADLSEQGVASVEAGSRSRSPAATRAEEQPGIGGSLGLAVAAD